MTIITPNSSSIAVDFSSVDKQTIADPIFRSSSLSVDGDNFKNEQMIDPSHYQEACEQLLADKRPEPKLFARIMARIVGRKTMRCISNLFSNLGFRALYDGHRDYPVLPATCKIKTSQGLALRIEGQEQTAQSLAQRFNPQFLTISPIQAVDKGSQIKEVRYEILPPNQGKPYYSIIYYVRRAKESLPIPILGKLYDWLRMVLYRTQEDWEPIQVNIHRDTGEPEGIIYETSNYTGDANTFDLVSPKNLHLCTKVVKQKNGSWVHTVYQKDGKSRSTEVQDPFRDHFLKIVFVSWNGLCDLESIVEKRGYQIDANVGNKKLYSIPAAPLTFLDIDTYRDNGIDLRAPWLNDRKKGRSIMRMPARRTHPVNQKLNLIGHHRMSHVVQGD